MPEHCKDFDKGYIFDREILNGIVEFEIKNETDVESYIIKLLSNKRISLKKTKELAADYWDKINSVRTALFDILQTYEDVISYKIIKSYYKLDYNIKTQERLKEKEEFEIAVIAETIEIVIRLLFEMRDIIVKNKSKILLSEF